MPENEEVVTAPDTTEKCVDSICESLSQSKIQSNDITDRTDSKPNSTIAPADDSRLVEEDSLHETSHVYTKDNDYHFDGEWLSSATTQAGIEPECDIFSQSFELSDHDGTFSIPDICDQKLSHSTKGATFGIELPGDTLRSSELPTSKTSKSSKTPIPKYQNYLVLNSEQRDSEDETVTALDGSFILPSISDFNLPPEPQKPFCHCREPTVDKISNKKNDNKDRTYYVCASNKCRVRNKGRFKDFIF